MKLSVSGEREFPLATVQGVGKTGRGDGIDYSTLGERTGIGSINSQSTLAFSRQVALASCGTIFLEIYNQLPNLV